MYLIRSVLIEPNNNFTYSTDVPVYSWSFDVYSELQLYLSISVLFLFFHYAYRSDAHDMQKPVLIPITNFI